ncbi:MAG: type II secretion system protein [Desulfobacteraceae bacterium]|nr:MAG: type II secretion system protein [Desulfobacteraceae bacterium]
MKGFTLIEVMVSMVIVAIALTIIMGSFSGGLKSKFKAREYDRAIELAEDKMDELLLSPTLELGTLEGEFDSGYTWVAAITDALPEPDEDTEDTEKPVELFAIRVEIQWGMEERKKTYAIETAYLPQAK